MKKLLAIVVVIISIVVACQMSAQPLTEKFSVQKEYLEQWNKLLMQIQVNDKLETAKQKLAHVATPIGFMRVGGTGNQLWYFRIDDFYEVVVGVDHNQKIIKEPTINTAQKWLRFPDGSIQTLPEQSAHVK